MQRKNNSLSAVRPNPSVPNPSVLVIVALITLGVILNGGCKQDSLRPTTRPVLKAYQQFPPVLPYVLQPGDVVDIKFYYQTTLNQSVTVRPDGKISLPLVDDIQAAGRTLPQLDQDLTNLYLQKIRDPELTVILTQATGQRIYVGGEVSAPGTFVLSGSVSAIQAIMQAGGHRKTGHMESVVVLRRARVLLACLLYTSPSPRD